MVITKLSPLKAALEMDVKGHLKKIGALYLQGEVKVDTAGRPVVDDNNCMLPSRSSSAFQADMDAAEFVFKDLMDHVPFTLLGKHTSSQVGVTVSDLHSWSRGSSLPCLEKIYYKQQMHPARLQDPSAFCDAHLTHLDGSSAAGAASGVDTKSKEESAQPQRDEDVVIYQPQDPLLALLLVRPSLFEKVEAHGHTLIGMTPTQHGVPDGEECRKELHKLVNISADKMRKPVLLITDIGRDIDDTVALFALRAISSIDFVGVVTCGGATLKRAKQARAWLRHLGVKDSDCQVAAGVDYETAPYAQSRSYGNVADVEHLFADESHNFALHHDATKLILSLAEEHGERLTIMGIGPLSPLSEALKADEKGCLKRIGKLYLQGIVSEESDSDSVRLVPNLPKSYNFREDSEAAKHVFKEMQDDVRFVTLGSAAAKKVGLQREDFASWDRGSGLPSLRETLHTSLAAFRLSAPGVFYETYPVPEDKRGDGTWYANTEGGVVSHPYDPLLALSLVRPELFEHEPCGGGGRHQMVGNSPEQHGVPDGEECRKELHKLVNISADKMRKPVLLITDIGRDIDDTVALFALRAISSIDFVGVVTCGGATLKRAKQARAWLRHLGVKDSDCQVAAGVDYETAPYAQSRSYGNVADVEHLFADESHNFALHHDATKLILSLAEEHGERLTIMGIGPLSPLSEALKADEKGCLKRIGKLYLQGIVSEESNSDSVRLVPNLPKSYNFREDSEAAKHVFKEMQDDVRFVTLGSAAAKKVGLQREDFASWDRGSGLPSLRETLHTSLAAFRLSAPGVFYETYPVPEDKRGDGTWYANMEGGVVSHPYDPLLALSLVRPELFEHEPCGGGGRHQMVGNSPEQHGVPDGEECRKELHKLVNISADKMRKPVLLITDIGRDIDDTVALFALRAISSIDFVGVVTCGGATLKRAKQARAWLRHLGVKDSDCQVAAGVDYETAPYAQSRSYGNVADVEHLFADESHNFALHHDATKLILSLAEEHGERLTIMGIGPLSPLSEALKADEKGCLKRIGKLYLQGIVSEESDSDSVRLVPNLPKSYNFREDSEAAKHVFKEMQDDVRFVTLGSAAAKKVGLQREDFASWDRGSGLPSLRETLHTSLAAFRLSAPGVFYETYPVPEDKRGDGTWYANMEGGVVSHPYDPLLALSLVRPELFEHEPCGGGGRHQMVGNSPEQHGVPDGEECRKELHKLVNISADKMRKPVLLITDIGRDIDDTVALFALRAISSIDFVGVVTCGGATLKRAKQARAWLRHLGVKDSDCQVAAGVDYETAPYAQSRSYGNVADVEHLFADESHNFALHHDATKLILSLAEEHGERLTIMGIGPLSPLSEALKADEKGCLKRIGKLYLQGIVSEESNSDSVRLVPNLPKSYNFREDSEAAKHVFKEMQDDVPFVTLGSAAAYRVGINTGDFASWDRGSGLPSLRATVRASLAAFRASSSKVFYDVYPVPEDKRGDEDWYDNMKDGVVSHPYDPLLALSLVRPELFEHEPCGGGGRHQMVGNSPEQHGVPDGEECRKELHKLVNISADKMMSESSAQENM